MITCNIDNVSVYEIPTDSGVIRAFRLSPTFLVPGGYYSRGVDEQLPSSYMFIADDDGGNKSHSYYGKLRYRTTDLYGKWIVVLADPSETISTDFYFGIRRMYRSDGSYMTNSEIPQKNRGVFYHINNLGMDSQKMLNLTTMLSMELL